MILSINVINKTSVDFICKSDNNFTVNDQLNKNILTVYRSYFTFVPIASNVMYFIEHRLNFANRY